MLLIIWGILIVCSLLFPKSKVLSGLMLVYMIIAVGFRTQGADYLVYQNEYKWSEYQSFKDVHYIGYLLLEQFAHNRGLSFEQFRIAVAVFSSVLVYYTFMRMTTNVNILIALYYIYPFAHDAVQTRTFLANSILLFAFSFLLFEQSNDRKKVFVSRAIFFALSAIACLIHFEAVIYVSVILLMMFLPKKYGRMYIISIAAILFALIGLGILPKIISQFNSRISYWISGKTGMGIVIPIIVTILIWYFTQYVGKYCLMVSEKDAVKKNYYTKLLRMNDFILLLIPFFCYDITFNRLWRIFLVILYAMISRIILCEMQIKIKRNIEILLVILLIVLVVYENEFTILYGFLQNNAIFESIF